MGHQNLELYTVIQTNSTKLMRFGRINPKNIIFDREIRYVSSKKIIFRRNIWSNIRLKRLILCRPKVFFDPNNLRHFSASIFRLTSEKINKYRTFQVEIELETLLTKFQFLTKISVLKKNLFLTKICILIVLDRDFSYLSKIEKLY